MRPQAEALAECNLMETDHDPDLKPSKLNVRRPGPKEIDSLAASIAGLGLIHPLLVRARDEGFEVVAGQRATSP